MKAVVDVPDEMAHVWEPGMGRVTLKRLFNLTELESRFYSKLLTDGELIHETAVAPTPPSGKVGKAGVLYDIHFPYHDKQALDAAINYCLKIGITELIVGGDGVDNQSISPWKLDPKRMSFMDEVYEVRSKVKWLSDIFKDQHKTWLEGNHEMWLPNLLNTELSQLARFPELEIPEWYHLTKHGFNFISCGELKEAGLPPYKVGKLFVLHGHEVKVSGGAVNFARLHYLKEPCNQLNGHHHTVQEYPVRKMDGEINTSVCAGCLCKLGARWTNSYNPFIHGFAIVHHDADGAFEIWNKKIINGRVY